MGNDIFGIGNQLENLVIFINKNIINFFKMLYKLYKFITKYILKTLKYLPLTIPFFILIICYILLFVKEEGQVDAMFSLLFYIGSIIILSAFSIGLCIGIIEIFIQIIIKIIKEHKKTQKAKKSSNRVKARISIFGLCLALIGTLFLMFICGLFIRYMAIYNNNWYKSLNEKYSHLLPNNA